MSAERDAHLAALLSASFRDAVAPVKTQTNRDRAAPFSIRLTQEERARLEAEAGSQPLGAYIRSRLLGDQAKKRRASRRPGVDHKKLALVLAELGRSRLASNMNQLAKAANVGALDVSPEVNSELQDACRSIVAIREMLIEALGVKPES